ncbi:heme biosynthesis protein HemY [Pseudaestuariivita atlantica]|uniref:Heme biosynthesis protein HemY n=1 Tax=Pseudaestuariivita atlantica TaxID=1317121 RepID=A0A0L1JPE0_9RHOB|nr:heme biosynthesis HemY N-terminal domain-containing protein [Pseudaestuariivita atlantica]KNG93635.1 heme biosynthesis protein HemY [Pseudaestuariivita atlantica]
MLWSLIKILFFISLVALLTLVATWLMGRGDGLMITFAGTEYPLSALQSVIALIVLVVLLWVVLKVVSFLVALVRFLNGDETAISRYFDRNRERRGYQALSEGLMALASGEGRLAMSKAARAEKYLQRPELTDLVTAQAAEMAGDRARAEETYKRLLQNDATRFVGVRGIMKQKLAAGDTETALKLAQKAFALKPRHEETQDVLLQLQTKAHDWTGARKTLDAKLKSGTMPRDVHRRREAVLALSQATTLLGDDEASIDARETAIEANRLSPDLIPAAIMAARTYIAQDKKRYATRVLKKAWEAQPHPSLAAAFAEIEPDETAQARLKRFQALTRLAPNHRESRLLTAELNIAAEDFPAARKAIGDLAEQEPDARVLTIMAAIERGEGASDEIVKGWLARAIAAPRGPQWVCDNCHAVVPEWTATCPNCDGLDTLTWKAPTKQEVATPTGVEMLPLIVGATDDKPDELTVPEAEIIEAVDGEIVKEADETK